MGNTIILKKVLEELEKSEPNISYVRGMVETLVSLNDKEAPTVSASYIVTPKVSPIPPTFQPTDPSIPPPPPGMAKILEDASKNIG